MSESSLLNLLQGGRQSSEGRQYGVTIALVTNVKDPDKLGRVKLKFPILPSDNESNWARVVQPSAGAGRGFYWIPQVDDEVLVAFENGDPNHPYVIGTLWNGKDKPPTDGYTDENTKILVQTKSGHQVLLDDKKDAEKIVIADKSGKRTLTFDVKNKKFIIEAKEGDVEIKAEKKIVLTCEDLEIKSGKTSKIEVGTTFDLKVSSTANIKSDSTLNIKASRVNIN